MTVNKFHFNEHKQDTLMCDWLIGHIIFINFFMDDEDFILDFFGKIFCITNELRSLGEVIIKVEVASKLL